MSHVSKRSRFKLSKWWVIAFALVVFAAVGCNIATSAITTRSVGATEGDELESSRLPALPTGEPWTGIPSDPSRRYRDILTPIVAQGPLTQAGLPAAAPTGPSAIVEAAPAEQAPTVAAPNFGSSQIEPGEPTSQFPDVTLTIKPTRTPTPALVSTPHLEEPITGESPQAGSTVTGGEDVSTPKPRQDCVRPGGMTLWLEPSVGEWSVPVGQSIEVNLCLSNLSADLAGFDVLLELQRTGTAEFRGISMGGFGLEIHSELPTESLRVRAIDLKKRLTAGTDGVVLATMQLVGIAVRESPITIGLNGIDDTDGNSVKALVLQASLQVTEG